VRDIDSFKRKGGRIKSKEELTKGPAKKKRKLSDVPPEKRLMRLRKGFRQKKRGGARWESKEKF